MHPGYGFFSENADFARALGDQGATFIGPPPGAIEIMGDKISSRRGRRGGRGAVCPGHGRGDRLPRRSSPSGSLNGWPVAIKAAYGGGGRGMKVVAGPDEAAEALESAKREAVAYFGRGEVYLERYLDWPRHVEIQLIADAHGICRLARRARLLVSAPAPEADRGVPGSGIP